MFILLIVSVSLSWASSDRRSNEIGVSAVATNSMPDVSYQHHQEQQHSKDSFVPLVTIESRENKPVTFYEPSYMQQTNSLSSSGDEHNSLQPSQQKQHQQEESIESNFDQVRRSFQTSHEQYSDILGLMMKDLEQRIQQQQQQQQPQQLQQPQPASLVPPSNRLSNLGTFAAMNGANANNYAEDPSKMGVGSNDQFVSASNPSSSSAALQYSRQPMFPGPMSIPGAFSPSPMVPLLGHFGSRRNLLLNPFLNPSFGSEYPFFPYNPIFSKLHTNPYLYSYMPFYPAPYGPGQYYQQRPKLQNAPQAPAQKMIDDELQPLALPEIVNKQSISAGGSLASTLLAVANYLTTPNEFEPTISQDYADRSIEDLAAASLPSSPSPLLSFFDEAASVDATANMLNDNLRKR